MVLDESLYNKIVGLFVEIQIEIANEQDVHLLRALLYEVLVLLQKAFPIETKKPVNAESRVVRFQELVNEHFATETGVDFYADKLCVTPNYLNRIVQRTLGQTTKAYIQSFRDFLGLASGDKVPDARTVWVFRNELASKGLVEILFKRFYKFLEDNHMILNEGMIIDGSFVEVPRQRNSREENKLIREDEGDKLWNEEMDDTEEDKKRKANKKRHKDTDARWTKKGGNTYYGYKSHAKVDAKSKLIKKCVATNASVHDSKPTRALVDKSDQGQELYADSAYIGKGVKRVLRKYGLKDRIIKRNVRGKKISKWQDTINRKNAKVRARVEHVFGIMEGCLHGMRSRAVGFLRNEAYIIFSGLVYNLIRYEQIKRLGMN